MSATAPPPHAPESPGRPARREAPGGTGPQPGEAETHGRAEPPPRVTPVQRLMSVAVAGFAALLGVGLVFGAQTAGVGVLRLPYAIVVFGVQLLFVVAYTLALRPPGVFVILAVGPATALSAGAVVVLPREAAIGPLLPLLGAGLVVGLIGQLVRREGRLRLTESLAATVVVVSGVLGYATLVLLTRLPIGSQAITVCLGAACLALVVARVADAVVPWPRVAPRVPRGATGVVAGAMAGTGVAAYLGAYIRGFEPGNAALLGLVAAVAAVLADLSVGYADPGRGLSGEVATRWVARHLHGPLAGFAVAAPLAYLLSAVFLVPRYV